MTKYLSNVSLETLFQWLKYNRSFKKRIMIMALTLGGGIVLPFFVQSQLNSSSKKMCKELVPSASSAIPTDQKASPTASPTNAQAFEKEGAKVFSEKSPVTTPVTTEYGVADFSLTEKLLAYMGALLERNILGDTHLHRLLEMTEQGKIQNPISEKDAPENKGLHVHRGGFEKLLRDKESLLDLPRIKVWTETMLAERGQIRKQRQETRKDTQYVPKPPQKIKIASNENNLPFEFSLMENGLSAQVMEVIIIIIIMLTSMFTMPMAPPMRTLKLTVQ